MFHVPCLLLLKSCNVSYVLYPLQLNLSIQHLSVATAIDSLCHPPLLHAIYRKTLYVSPSVYKLPVYKPMQFLILLLPQL